MKQGGLILGAVAAGGVLLLASGASARGTRTAARTPYTRERFVRFLSGLGLDPAKLSEADWQIIDRAMADAERIATMPPENQGHALQESGAFRAYIEMLIARYGDDWRRIMERS